MRLLDSLPEGIISAGPPALQWILEPRGEFSVRSFARQLAMTSFGGLNDFPADVIWNKQVPTKVACFIWQVAHGSISTIDNLRRRGLQIPNRCIMCGYDAESIRHLFFECSFAVHVWSLLSSRLSLFGPIPGAMTGILAAWKGLNWERDFEACGEALLHGVCWCIWLERNARTFRDECATWEEVALRIGRMVDVWCGSSGLLAASNRPRWVSISRHVREPY
ncbi:Putative ribonuclease H protein At1g65750 [Linum perenne]